VLVMVLGADFPDVGKELGDRVLCGSRHSTSSADRAAFNEAADDLSAGSGVQAVHVGYYAEAALACQEGMGVSGIVVGESTGRRDGSGKLKRR
jgi:hypothetical protein